MSLVQLDHIQLAMPEGGEDAARRFYRDLLGLREVEKPDNLKKRGGCWFEAASIKLHLGVEADFRPARKAHPAFLVPPGWFYSGGPGLRRDDDLRETFRPSSISHSSPMTSCRPR